MRVAAERVPVHSSSTRATTVHTHIERLQFIIDCGAAAASPAVPQRTHTESSAPYNCRKTLLDARWSGAVLPEKSLLPVAYSVSPLPHLPPHSTEFPLTRFRNVKEAKAVR